MERSLFLWALLLAAVGGLFSLSSLATRRLPRSETPRITSAGWIVLVLTLAMGALLTFPPPHVFAAGHGPGIGFAIGGLGALVVAAVVNRFSCNGEQAGGPLASFTAAVAITASLVPEIWLRHKLLDAQCGVMMGWLAELLVYTVIAPRVSTIQRNLAVLVAGTGLLVTMCAGMSVAEFRAQLIFGTGIQPVHWSAMLALGAAPIPAVLVVMGLAFGFAVRLPGASLVAHITSRWLVTDRSRTLAARLLTGAAAGVVVMLAFRVVEARAAAHPPLFALVGAGVAVALAAHWLVSSSTGDNVVHLANRNGSIAVLIVAAACVAAYQREAGFGVALITLPAWAVALMLSSSVGSEPSWREGAALRMNSVLMLGTVMLLYRFVDVRFHSDLYGLSDTSHYQLFGLLTGLFAPLLAAGLITVRVGAEPASLGRRALAGITVGLVGPVLAAAEIMIFGPKCAAGYVMGSALACALIVTGSLISEGTGWDDVTVAVAILASLTGTVVIAQWMHALLPLSLLSRAARAHMVLEAGVAMGVLIVLQSVGMRRIKARTGAATEQQ